MLNSTALKLQLQTGFSAIFKTAIETMMLNMFPETSNAGNEYAKRAADDFDKLVSDDLATLISTSIDAYIKNASITGTIITAGSPSTQTAKISSLPTPVSNGKVPNTLGIN